MIALKYALIVTAIALASILARNLIVDFRSGVAQGNLKTYSKVEHRATFWFLTVNRSMLLAMVFIAVICLLFWGA